MKSPAKAANVVRPVPGFANQSLGKFDVIDDRSECETEYSHPDLSTGAIIGRKIGYSSFDAGLEALTNLTQENEESAALVRQGTRFYGYELKESGTTYFPNFDDDGSGLIQVYGKKNVSPNLAAIVDGDFNNTFND